MAKWTPIQVAGGAYSDDCLPWASQDTVNYIPVMAEKAGTRSPAMLRCLPGNTLFSVTGSNAPVRAMRNVEGRLLSVSGNALYRIGTDGAAVSLGVIPGVARCSMAHNQISGGNQVAIANGQSGYIYSTVDDSLVQITDEGFPGAKVFDFLDGYFLYVEPQGRFWGWSDLAAGTEYNTLDRSEAEAQPDRIVTGIVTHGEWLVLGERSGEFYYNAGTATGTFQRREGATLEIGCAGTHAIARIDNSAIWLGHDGIVYRLEGYQPRRISTHALEQAISRCNMSQAFATVFEDRGHKVWYLTFPDGRTWGYDVATGEWHRRRSDGLDRWRMNALVRWRNRWLAGDYSNGKIYLLDWEVQSEDGAEMERLRTLPIAHANGNKLTINAVRFEFDTGVKGVPTPFPRAALTLSGDIVGGYVGDPATGGYTSAGGMFPHTYAITSGALPTGLTLDPATGQPVGTMTAEGEFAWNVTVTDYYGETATIGDTATVFETLACGTQNSFSGSGGFPFETAVTLGSATGTVTLLYLTGRVADRIVVEFDGVDVIDTGYVGDGAYVPPSQSLTVQELLDAALTARGLPTETVVQLSPNYVQELPLDVDTNPGTETAWFVKSSAATTAIVKVYSPIEGLSSWAFRLGCPA